MEEAKLWDRDARSMEHRAKSYEKEQGAFWFWIVREVLWVDQATKGVSRAPIYLKIYYYLLMLSSFIKNMVKGSVYSPGSDQAEFLNYFNNHSKNHHFSCLEATFQGQKEHSKELVTTWINS